MGALFNLSICAVLIAGVGVVRAETIIPEEKHLEPTWLASLTQRGTAEDSAIRGSKQDNSLQFIGMPVGGIGCGTVYLNGDGRLFVWDIFNQHHEGVVIQTPALPPEMHEMWGKGGVIERNGANYVNPPTPDSFPAPFEQGFGVNISGIFRRFQQSDWARVEFEGTWPSGTVNYRDPDSPIEVTLRAFSPFIPLNLNDSSLPVTCMEFTLKNRSANPVSAELSGWLENAAGLYARQTRKVVMDSQRSETSAAKILTHNAWEASVIDADNHMDTGSIEDIVFADFEGTDYGDWTVQGTAFGTSPIHKNRVPPYQGDLNIQGDGAVNSHSTAPDDNIEHKDAASGRLISPEFTIERNYIEFLIGGGQNADIACMNLLVNGQVVRTATGKKSNRMESHFFEVSDLQGQSAHLEIVDAGGGSWANIGVDQIVFCDQPASAASEQPFSMLPDAGTMALAVLNGSAQASDQNGVPGWEVPLSLAPGEEKKVVFLLGWHFPNIYPLPGFPSSKRHYSARFADASEAAKYVAENYSRLRTDTFAWVDTWYDSTLPEWLLARTLLTADTLQTANCFIFEDGQFWAWEGIGACAGTCTHVWQYAQALARLFPSIERNLREVTDYGYAQDSGTGIVRFRGKQAGLAVDGQAGIVLRTLREHKMSVDEAFLRRVWPNTKLALQTLIHQDGNGDGLLKGAQHNTLDADWYGPVAWLSGEYLAALRAGEEMALEMGDTDFAEHVRAIFEAGQTNLVEQLFDAKRGYFINCIDTNHLDSINSGTGCHIDQVFGQSWAFQNGLGRVLPEAETRSALRALWKHNFLTDVGPYRMVNKPGRWYAMPGEAGLLMCTFPYPDWSYTQSCGVNAKSAWAAMYFNECMSGFEYQVASHMVYEGTPDLVRAGLAVTRAVHDRYSSTKRNPYNEIECSDHYGRAAASYGVFLAVCGYDYHGPKKILTFAPRIGADNFRAAFTAAEGWGSFSMKQSSKSLAVELDLRYGTLTLRSLNLPAPEGLAFSRLDAAVNGKDIDASLSNTDGMLTVQFMKDVILHAGDQLTLKYD